MKIEYDDLKKAYIAGLVDGEGCIHIQKRYDTRRGRCRNYYKLDVIISMKNRSGIDYVRSVYGGTLTTVVHGGQNIYKNRRYWRLVIGSTNALKMLRELYPYLIVKKNTAEYAIAFQEHVESNRRARWTKNYTIVEEQRELVYLKYRAAAETERESGLPDRKIDATVHSTEMINP